MLIPGIITHYLVRQNFPGFQGLWLVPRGNQPGREWNPNSRIWTSTSCSSPTIAAKGSPPFAQTVQIIREQPQRAERNQTLFVLSSCTREQAPQTLHLGRNLQKGPWAPSASWAFCSERRRKERSHKEFIWTLCILLVLLWNKFCFGSFGGEINK